MKTTFLKTCGDLLGRVVALAFLIVLLPTLLLIGSLLRMNSDEPVLLTDELPGSDGTRFRIHRFRTAGPGTKGFKAFGRFLRTYAFDDFPGLWDVVCGHIGLRQFYSLDRNR